MTAQQRLARLVSLVPRGSSRAARTPFVLLMVLLLGGGLLALLLLNASLNNGSFELDDLERETKELTDEQQALEQEVSSYSAPGVLDKRARELGMVPGGPPAFLNPDGTVRGVPGAAGARGVSVPATPGSGSARTLGPNFGTAEAEAGAEAAAETETPATAPGLGPAEEAGTGTGAEPPAPAPRLTGGPAGAPTEPGALADDGREAP